MSILAGKTGIVVGVANKRSIAWAIAQAWHKAGAKLAFTYQGERLKENVEELAGSFGADTPILPCDVTKDEDIARVFKTVSERFGKLDLLLHSVAFAPKDALEGEFVNTSREAFRVAHDVSAYSLVALSRAAAPLMGEGGSIVAMTYYGAEKVVPHYNVMGVAKASLEASTRYLAYDLGPKKIRVNCISAGPVNTLAARGISGFMEMLKHYDDWGGPGTYPHMAAGWAVAGDTPFMWTKQIPSNYGGTRNGITIHTQSATRNTPVAAPVVTGYFTSTYFDVVKTMSNTAKATKNVNIWECRLARGVKLSAIRISSAGPVNMKRSLVSSTLLDWANVSIKPKSITRKKTKAQAN